MEESILTSIKKLLGITEEYEHFDKAIIIHINSVFMILTKRGVGAADGFNISSKKTTWSEFTKDDKKIEAVKSYVYMKVKLLFDPPASSSGREATNRDINEFEWRLTLAANK